MKLILLITFFLFSSCSGYKIKAKSNPFHLYGVKKLYIPQFYNHSNISYANGHFTKEIIEVLLDFNDLEIVTDRKSADAVLLGIVSSANKLRDTIITTARKNAETSFGEEAIGDKREKIVLPATNKISLNLKIIVLKDPTQTEIAFFQKNSKNKFISSKVIFNENIRVTETFNLKELSGEGIEVLGTQNRGLQKLTVKAMAVKAADSFKDMILYVF